MKAKVINNMSEYFGQTLDVKQLNYKHIFGHLSESHEKVKVMFEDVEFIFEQDWEKKITKYRNILNISLPKGVSPKFYAAVACALEEHHGSEIVNVYMVRDINESARKKYWYKKLAFVINNTRPVIMTSSGRQYSGIYNINIEDMNIESLIVECKEDICKLKKVIGMSVEQISAYEKILYNLENPDTCMYKAIEGR